MKRALLGCGMAMPFIYLLALVAASLLNPDFNLMAQDPSQLGRETAALPRIYNAGMMISALAGILAGFGLLSEWGRGHGFAWRAASGITVLLASAGLGMAGLFPLPSPWHYGFGLTGIAVLTPLFGAGWMWRSMDDGAALLLLLGFALMVGLMVTGAPPLAPGMLMLVVIAALCWIAITHIRRRHW